VSDLGSDLGSDSGLDSGSRQPLLFLRPDFPPEPSYPHPDSLPELSYLHPDFLPELAFVLELDDKLIGNVMYTRSWLLDEQDRRKTILTFGPVSIHPDYQRKGYGKLLLEHSFAAAKELGYDAIVIFGDPDNYVSRGFRSCRSCSVSLEGDLFPTALLVKELTPGVLSGKHWRYVSSSAEECCSDTAAVEAFDAGFPPKEKGWQPSQEAFYIHSHSMIVR